MDTPAPEVLEKIRQQFDTAPYPRVPLEKSPKGDYSALYIHNLLTPYYLKHQRVIETGGKMILDAGCGSGWKSLTLAEANPGAQIVGIDISEESIELARQRLQYHGFDNVEFHVLAIDALPKLGLKFDYINCDEVLYLLPGRDPSVGLKAFKSVLQPQGIIRTNLHSSLQRVYYFRAQELFKSMGLLDNNPGALEVEIVIETMKALKDQVEVKAKTWQPKYEQIDNSDEVIFMNYLFQGDQGYTIPEMFTALKSADLELISMVEWRRWELMDLFKDPEDLPAVWAMGLPELSVEERLRLFELIHPIHRLLDFWCTHPHAEEEPTPVAAWEASDWQTAWVHLHPQLQVEAIKTDLIAAVKNQQPFEISRYITLPTTTPIVLDTLAAASLIPLWEGKQPFTSLVSRWHQLRPLDALTLEPVTPETAFEEVRQNLIKLESFLYVLVEKATLGS
jgi:2-polyprenyl-3-methyl-5-hydroxy-6-metoxy-1,4-benzoquinol methylase